ncbi:MAG: rhomboid family intramembrane serine protease [Muribaculaceae bacterium]|nr:rhomboid family intramembrane serine protease [Muribaculaceae bacterium]
MLKAFRILSDSTATLALSALIIAVFFISPDISLGGDWYATASEPWRLAAYSLLHNRPQHLVINLALLLSFGSRYETSTSALRLLVVFIAGGIMGGTLFAAASAASGNTSVTLCGSSAAVIAVMCACQTDRRSGFSVWGLSPFFVPILLTLDSIMGLFGSNTGGSLAHIGGIIAGVAAGLLANRPSTGSNHPGHIIGKAERSGYSSLTGEERDILFNQNSTEK